VNFFFPWSGAHTGGVGGGHASCLQINIYLSTENMGIQGKTKGWGLAMDAH
jgi:hypothetical protein